MTNQQLADLMFPAVTKTPEDYEALYPPRQLKEGAKVTRIAPSPTGYLHLGVFFVATIDRLVAGEDGVFYFRLEDTDRKREVAGGAEDLVAGLNHFGLTIDEGHVCMDHGKLLVVGDYGPYIQSHRTEIYHAYVKKLVAEGLAYPCFCTEEDRAAARGKQEAAGLRTGYWGEFAVCRGLDNDTAAARIRVGERYVVRLRSPGSETNRIKFDDLIKGTIEMPENDEDFVLLKSNGIPTYHLPHVVDDHLMRTTHAIRGEEWISSTPKHLQLFRLFGWKPPKYAHISLILKEENGGKRKISKRKDPEAAMHFYTAQGYPVPGVREYLMTIANSDFEEWRARNPVLPLEKFPFSLKKMSLSGALFDQNKLNDVCKNVVAGMTAADVAAAVTAWAAEFDPDFHALLARDPDYTRGIFAIDRGGAKPRKDIAKWSDAKDYAAYFFDELFQPSTDYPENISPDDRRAVFTAYAAVYDPAQDKTAWFETVKSVCEPLGYCSEVKRYKQEPEKWKGHAGDVSTALRVAVTGRRNTPDLCGIMALLGRKKVLERLKKAEY